MKRIIVVLAVAVVLCVLISPGLAATPEQIEASIDSGIGWLAAQQLPDGSWGSSWGEGIGYTGFALLKLEDYAYEQGYESPFDPEYIYAPKVEAGFDYIFKYYYVGDHDSDGIPDGYFDQGGYHQTYCTAVGLMAIASSGTSERVVVSTNAAANGKTFQQIAEECVEWLSATQNPDGGWRYVPLDVGSDQSNTGWATMGLTYANIEFGIDISTILPGLHMWVDAIQNKDDPSSSLYGASEYTINGGWENILKTGSLLYQFAMLSTPETDEDVQAAIGFIENYWNAPGCDYNGGWLDHRQAMFCMMKGLEAYNVEMLDLDGDSIPETDWFDVVSTHLVTTQNPEGSWPGDCWAGPEASTAWALLTLERTVIVPNNPPDISEAYAEPGCLWPPNHKFVDGEILGVTDPDGDVVTITITAITSDEPTSTDKGSGGAKHAPDASINGAAKFSVRSECSGTADGRVYTILFRATDDKGAESTGSVTVGVPHDQSPPTEPCQAVDSGQFYDATAIN